MALTEKLQVGWESEIKRIDSRVLLNHPKEGEPGDQTNRESRMHD